MQECFRIFCGLANNKLVAFKNCLLKNVCLKSRAWKMSI